MAAAGLQALARTAQRKFFPITLRSSRAFILPHGRFCPPSLSGRSTVLQKTKIPINKFTQLKITLKGRRHS
jgi:hypothetical protein